MDFCKTFYEALCKGIGKTAIPEHLRGKHKIITYFGYERHTTVHPLTLLKTHKIENELKININLFGVIQYQSSKSYPQTLNLQVSKNKKSKSKKFYYTVLFDKKSTVEFDLMYNKRNIQPEHFRIYYHLEVDKVQLYDGKNFLSFSKQEIYEMNHSKKYCCWMIDEKTKPENLTLDEYLKQQYEFIYSAGKELLEITKEYKKDGTKIGSFINIFNFTSFRKCLIHYFYYFSRTINKPEDVNKEEFEWLDDSCCGALMACEEDFKGELIEYDVKSFYPFLLQSQYFNVPIKKGKFKIMSNEEFEECCQKGFFPYGVYRCNIHSYNNYCFRNNKKNKYTHFDLKSAVKLNLKIELVQDGENNVLLYDKDSVLRADKIFKPYIDYFYKLRESCDGETEQFVKWFLSKLWGTLCMKNQKQITTSKGLEYDENEYDIKDMTYENLDRITIKLIHKTKPFRYVWGRMKSFLLSYARNYMMTHFIYDYMDYVKKVQTDGVCMTQRIPELDKKIGNKIGQLKRVELGKCHIIHLNNVLTHLS